MVVAMVDTEMKRTKNNKPHAYGELLDEAANEILYSGASRRHYYQEEWLDPGGRGQRPPSEGFQRGRRRADVTGRLFCHQLDRQKLKHSSRHR